MPTFPTTVYVLVPNAERFALASSPGMLVRSGFRSQFSCECRVADEQPVEYRRIFATVPACWWQWRSPIAPASRLLFQGQAFLVGNSREGSAPLVLKRASRLWLADVHSRQRTDHDFLGKLFEFRKGANDDFLVREKVLNHTIGSLPLERVHKRLRDGQSGVYFLLAWKAK